MAKRRKARKRDPSVLVVVPTHESKRYSIKDCLENLQIQTYHNYRVLVLINNSSLSFGRWIQKYVDTLNRRAGRRLKGKHILGRERFLDLDIGKMKGEVKGDILAHVCNYGIDFADRYDWEYVLIVGADICLPNRGIRVLLEAFEKYPDCGIACLTCYLRMDMDKVIDNVCQALGMDPQQVDSKVPMVLMPEGSSDMTPKEYFKQPWLKALAGDGAMLSPRRVFEKVKWRPSWEEIEVGSDFQYCIDVYQELGLWTYINTEIYSPHLDEREDGKVEII